MLSMIFKGTVEVRRYQIASANPNYVMNSRPLDPSAWKAHCTRPRTGVAGSEHGYVPWWTTEEAKSLRVPKQGKQLFYGELGRGDAFFSLPFIPLWGHEPFTFTVTSETCEVFTA